MSYYQSNTANLGISFNAGTEFASVKASECTYIFVWQPAAVSNQGLLSVLKSSSSVASIKPRSDGKIQVAFDGSSVTSTASYAVEDRWRIDVIRKPSSGTNAVRHSYYIFDEAVWHHTNMASTIGDSSSSAGIDQWLLWSFDTDENMYGNAAGMAIVTHLLSDADCEGLEIGLPAWVARGYEFAIGHDQSAKTDSLVQRGTDDGTFVSYGSGASDPSTVDWQAGFYDPSISPYNPQPPWSYSSQFRSPGTYSCYFQRLTFIDSFSDAPGWTLGLRGSAHGSGSVTAVWFFPPAGASGDYGWKIYEGHVGQAGGVLASGTIADGSYNAATGWQRFPITPLDVSGINFMVCLELPGSGVGANNYRYASMDGTHISPPDLDNGVVVLSGGCYNSSYAKPNNTTSNIYNMDFEFTPFSEGGFPGGMFLPFFH